MVEDYTWLNRERLTLSWQPSSDSQTQRIRKGELIKMPRWKEEVKIQRVEAKQPNGEKAILVLELDPKNKLAGIKLLRKENLCSVKRHRKKREGKGK